MSTFSDGRRKVTWLRDQRPTAPDGGRFCSNKVVSSKYTCLTFLPKNIFEQLQKFGNCYFLLISILMYIGERTPLFIGTIKAFSTLLTLLMMMAVSALVALFDDYRRAAADKEINESMAYVITPMTSNGGGIVQMMWQELAVGDLVVVYQGDDFPADVVPLYCSNEGGTCFVSTANLDGETNLKQKSALAETQALLGSGAEDTVASRFLSTAASVWQQALIEAEAPNVSIYSFNGVLTLPTQKITKGLSADQLLLRGTRLRNTKFAIGVIVYTGKDTRMVMNSRPAPMKMSNVERVINQVMLVVLCAQVMLALLSDVLYLLNGRGFANLWYLYPPQMILPEWLGYFLTFFVLYSNLMPISLYPTLEVCNTAQSYFIKNDLRMYYKDDSAEISFPAGVRSSNLCQDIGQVNYIFSDKTGTLTQNVMELKRISVQGQKFGELQDVSVSGFSDAERVKAEPGEAMDSFLEVMAVCHTVMIAEGKGPDGSLQLEAESPDEAALVVGARDLGWEFQGRDRKDVIVTSKRQSSCNGDPPKKLKYTLHAVNAFNSTRKRMSAVLQDPSGTFHLFMKGADNVMLERASETAYNYNADLDEFSRQGLRTLVFGRRPLTQAEVTGWCARFEAAQQQVTDRESALDKLAAEIENNVDLVGVTAIEDKLQTGVPETIEQIRKAGIKLWVLTGDKLETARNIGFSARVLTDEMLIQTVDVNDHGSDPSHAETAILQLLDGIVKACLDSTRAKACLVTGKALERVVASGPAKESFLRLAKLCSIVIACRVSPLQKAEMVRLVRENVKIEALNNKPQGSRTRTRAPVTLAIGDGANDVPMIQEAQVGVGIAGREGRQAVNNSDIAIGQFRFLQRLLIVHGHWNYRRVCKFTLFTFWRNAVQVLLIFYYTFQSGYSGTSLFEDWIRLSFNFLCSIPIMATGCFDQDLPDKVILRHPELYGIGRDGMDLNPWLMGETLVSAIVHSVALALISSGVAPAMATLGAGDYYSYGTAAYTFLLIGMNVRVLALNFTHNLFTLASFPLSFGLYVLYLIVYPCLAPVARALSPNMYMVPWHLAQSIPFWICVFAVPALGMTMDMVIQLIYTYYWLPKGDLRTQEVYRIRHLYFKWECRRADAKRTAEEEDEEAPGESLPEVAGSGQRRRPPIRRSRTKRRRRPGNVRVCCKLLICPRRLCPQRVPREMLSPPADGRAFAQQRLRGWHLGNPKLFVLLFSVASAAWLAFAGFFWCWSSDSVSQVRVHYAGSQSHDPLGTRPQEAIFHNGQCEPLPGGEGRTCTIQVAPPFELKPPIFVFYEIGPFYQNHNSYLKSEVAKELAGEADSESLRSLRKRLCAAPTREDDKNNSIVPCGMKANSLFNDTLTITDLKSASVIEIDDEGISWPSDRQRYKNPSDYRTRNHTSWLYDRLPALSHLEEEGVSNEHFQVWMRPAAFSTVTNLMGRIINTTIEQGQPLELTIQSNFPLPSQSDDAYKLIVFTELSYVGGRSSFGHFLLFAATLCFLGGILAFSVASAAENKEENIDAEVLPMDFYESDNEPFLLSAASLRQEDRNGLRPREIDALLSSSD